MTKTKNEFMPRARRDGLVVRELSGELLIYDRDRNKAHCLNESAASIWNLCDGQTTVCEMSSLLQAQTTARVDEQVIWYALDQFTRDHLLEKRAKLPVGVERMSRRELIQRIGFAVSIPVVVSIIAPSVFAAASCSQGCVTVINCTVPGCQVACKSNVCSATP